MCVGRSFRVPRAAAVIAAAQEAPGQGAPDATKAPADTSWVKESRPPDREAVYRKTPQGELKLLAYLPEGWKKEDRRPAIVFFFGGAWTNGTTSQFMSKSEYFASRGMVAFCAEYRIGSKHHTRIDAAVEDARSAMRFVRKHAAEWGVDGASLVSAGGSAGAHLAACCALLDGPDAKDDDTSVSCRPQAMVLFNPVLDLNEPQAQRFIRGNSPEETRTIVETLSPALHLKKDCPPALIFYGTADAFVAHGRAFVKKSLALGNAVELWTAAGQPHGFFNRAPWHEATVRKADEFLASLGWLAGPPTMKPADDKAALTKELPTPQPAPEGTCSRDWRRI